MRLSACPQHIAAAGPNCRKQLSITSQPPRIKHANVVVYSFLLRRSDSADASLYQEGSHASRDLAGETKRDSASG
jgi:hypothetical protein